jgi:dolichol-phosphate mannosyltransferase
MSLVGFFFSFLSFIIGITYFILKIFHFEITAGLPTTILIVTFFSGIQLMALGIVGEYIARIYDQVKERPRYIIKNKTNIQDDEKN